MRYREIKLRKEETDFVITKQQESYSFVRLLLFGKLVPVQTLQSSSLKQMFKNYACKCLTGLKKLLFE
jgi:hypothetical protein